MVSKCSSPSKPMRIFTVKRPLIAARKQPRMPSIFAGSRSSPPPTFFLYTLGAGQPMFKSMPATGSCSVSISCTVRSRSGKLSPINWMKTGRPVPCSQIESMIDCSSREWQCTRKNSVNSRSGAPYLPSNCMNGKLVTSCIGASAVHGWPGISVSGSGCIEVISFGLNYLILVNMTLDSWSNIS